MVRETCNPRSNRTVGTSSERKDGGRLKAKLPEWRPNKDGSISCPPESLGGCGGKGILRLIYANCIIWMACQKIPHTGAPVIIWQVMTQPQ